MRPTTALRQLRDVARAAAVGQAHTLTRPSPLIRPLSPKSPVQITPLESDFLLYPDFFSPAECRQLIGMSLWKLDRADSTRRRKRKGGQLAKTGEGGNDHEALQGLFEGEYGFEEGHYDSVINHYRETLLSNFPPQNPAWPDHLRLMKRIYDLLPTSFSPTPPSHIPRPPSSDPDTLPPPGTSTHLLHLAPHGQILPHVDNLEASGSVIIGTSLGAERILRLKEKDGEAGWEVRLPSGSVYLQRDAVRYKYEHSILSYKDEGSVWDGERLRAGHRISIMVRDAPARKASLE